MIFRTCPFCGCALDPGERCDCQDEKREAAPAAPGTTSGKTPNASLSVVRPEVKAHRGYRYG